MRPTTCIPGRRALVTPLGIHWLLRIIGNCPVWGARTTVSLAKHFWRCLPMALNTRLSTWSTRPCRTWRSRMLVGSRNASDGQCDPHSRAAPCSAWARMVHTPRRPVAEARRRAASLISRWRSMHGSPVVLALALSAFLRRGSHAGRGWRRSIDDVVRSSCHTTSARSSRSKGSVLPRP